VIIRPATPGDIEPLATLAAAAYRATFLAILGEAGLAQRQKAFFVARFSEQWPTLRVAEKHGRILGFNQVRDGTLDMLFLDPALTGKGIGKRMLVDAERQGAVRLECFRDNSGARRFYERAGWWFKQEYQREFVGRDLTFVAYEKARTIFKQAPSAGCPAPASGAR
jgi:putative acetyltransferase